MSDDDDDYFVKINTPLEIGDILVADTSFNGASYVFFRVASFTKTGKPRLEILKSKKENEYCTRGALEWGCIVSPTEEVVGGALLMTRPKDKEYLSVKFKDGRESHFLRKYEPEKVYKCIGYG